MERDESTVIFWRNEETSCKVIFTSYNGVNDDVFILARKQIWKGGDIYGTTSHTAHELSKEKARQIWKNLVELHHFKRIGFEQQAIHTNSE